MQKKSKKSALYFLSILTPFFLFFTLGFFIFFKGQELYDKGEGLADGTEVEYIVQYMEKVVPPLPLEVYPELRADKVRIGEESRAVIHVRNIGKKLIKFYVNLKTEPANFPRLEIRFDPKKNYSLEEGEQIKLYFPYSLRKGHQESQDGTLDMQFIFSL